MGQLRQLEIDSSFSFEELEQLWVGLDAACDAHPEDFSESLQQLLLDLSDKNEIERDLLSKLVLTCGNVSLVDFIRLSSGAMLSTGAAQGAIASARHNLKAKCEIVTDVSPVVGALNRTRVTNLGRNVKTIIEDPHIHSVDEAERKFWQSGECDRQLKQLASGCILVTGYAPSMLLSALKSIEQGELQLSLIIGMSIGFSHAPAAKRRLMRSGIEYIITSDTFGGGLLAAVAMNALVESLIDKPNCHCYLGKS